MKPEPDNSTERSDDMKRADEANGERHLDDPDDVAVNDTEARYGDDESPA